jgi:hypothetical protein
MFALAEARQELRGSVKKDGFGVRVSGKEKEGRKE